MNWMLVLLTALLSGCQATMVSYHTGRTDDKCPPVVQVTSFGNSMTVTDGSECKKEEVKK